MAYVNSFQVNPNTLTRCLIIKPNIVGIPLVAVVVIGTRKLKSMLPQTRAVAFNSGHLEQPTESKTFTDDEDSSRANQLPDSIPEEENRRGREVEERWRLQSDDGDDSDDCDCSGGHGCDRSSSGDWMSEGAAGEGHVIDFEWRNGFDWSKRTKVLKGGF